MWVIWSPLMKITSMHLNLKLGGIWEELIKNSSEHPVPTLDTKQCTKGRVGGTLAQAYCISL